VICLGAEGRRGAVSIIGAVSPPGGDLSEPVVQATLRVVKVFWGLDDKLAFSRHFPAVNWLTSYSLYQGIVDHSLDSKMEGKWSATRKQAMTILQREAELEELVRLVGIDSLAHEDRLLMQAAKMIREDFLHQNAFDDRDTYTSLEKQHRLLNTILRYYEDARKALKEGVPLDTLLKVEALDDVARAKLIPENQAEQFSALEKKISDTLGALPR
jgi:V/A-type H+-transporting ATPase subunit A